MNLVELIGVTLALTAGAVSSVILGREFGWWGYFVGAPIGIALILALQYLLIVAEGVIRKIGIPLPECRNHKCNYKDYKIAPNTRNREIECRCGDHYKLSRKTLFYITSDRRVIPYMRRLSRWKWVALESKIQTEQDAAANP